VETYSIFQIVAARIITCGTLAARALLVAWALEAGRFDAERGGGEERERGEEVEMHFFAAWEDFG
jgi:hypothetical protein